MPDYAWVVVHIALIILFAWANNQLILHRFAKNSARRRVGHLVVNRDMLEILPGQESNPDNLYWVFKYDISERDLQVSGEMPEAVYWSLIAYDRFTMPHPLFYYDENVPVVDGRFQVILTTRPQGRVNELVLSDQPTGFIMVRVTSPSDPNRARLSKPILNSL